MHLTCDKVAIARRPSRLPSLRSIPSCCFRPALLPRHVGVGVQLHILRRPVLIEPSCWLSRNACLASAIAGVEFVRGEHDGGGGDRGVAYAFRPAEQRRAGC
ncbi:hypothetical protein SASPL_114959 [Salvia splendens]|uniref:Uncharacterized protein n=1 Tax=Salvia splendens TaxID=180675 RepID=A0A8X9A1N9_SALSN|nr:hypothetical protein SASPL_114959 [Salvia splendens]